MRNNNVCKRDGDGKEAFNPGRDRTETKDLRNFETCRFERDEEGDLSDISTGSG